MWRPHLTKIIFSLLLLAAATALALQLGNFKSRQLLDGWDCLGELTTLALACGWLCLVVSSRPPGPVTNWLFSGSFLLAFSYSLDLLDEFLAYPPDSRVMSWLESLPAPLGMVLLTIGLVGWHREQLAINRQLQGRELFLRDHQLIDPLTQLYGPAYLHAVLSRELGLHRESGRPLSLLMLDLAGFGRYNRQHGVAAGDQLLVRLSELLSHQLRPHQLVCRLAGDCFVALLPDTPASAAELLQLHLQQQWQQLHKEPALMVVCLAVPPAQSDAESLLRQAASLLRQHKQKQQHPQPHMAGVLP